MMELCGCGHANDHIGRPCEHEAPAGSGLQKCPCPSGMRSDIAMLRQLSQMAMTLNNIGMNVFKSLMLQQALSGQEVIVDRAPNGDINVHIAPLNQPKSSGIVAATAIPNLGGRGNG